MKKYKLERFGASKSLWDGKNPISTLIEACKLSVGKDFIKYIIS